MISKEILAVAVPFSIAVGACYLFGYWGPVGINLLEFVGFTDIAKLAIYPLVASLALFFLGLVLSLITTGNRMPVGGGRHTKVGQFGRRFARELLALVVLAIIGVYAIAPEPFKWLGIAFLAVFFAAPLANMDAFVEALPSSAIRFALTLLLLMLPALSFAVGRADIYFARNLVSAKTVDVERSKLPLTSETKLPVIYLGLLGSTFVLLETKTGQLILVKQDRETPLFIIPPGVSGRPI